MPHAAARNLALICLLPAGIGAVSWAATAESDGGGERSRFDERCRPANTRLVVANRYARVYYEKADSFLHYCRPGRREPEITFHAEDVYPPPAISLVGPYLGYASRVFEGQVEDNVAVVDVRGEPPRARAGS